MEMRHKVRTMEDKQWDVKLSRGEVNFCAGTLLYITGLHLAGGGQHGITHILPFSVCAAVER